MAKYRKKPVVIEAIQLTNKSIIEVINWITNYTRIKIDTDKNDNIIGIIIPTLEGEMKASIGDYIIKEPFDKERQFYPCKSDIFEKTYELIEQ